jgi:putative PIN family toxin of toxin-antitoxin system
MPIIVVDTNVWYQALRNSQGASHYILRLVYQREIEVALSVPVVLEYEDVLLRPKSLQDLGRSAEEIETFLRFLLVVGLPYKIHYQWRPNLVDEADNMFVELAVASRSRFLITSNVKDFMYRRELRLDGVQVMTPTEFVKVWRQRSE